VKDVSLKVCRTHRNETWHVVDLDDGAQCSACMNGVHQYMRWSFVINVLHAEKLSLW